MKIDQISVSPVQYVRIGRIISRVIHQPAADHMHCLEVSVESEVIGSVEAQNMLREKQGGDVGFRISKPTGTGAGTAAQIFTGGRQSDAFIARSMFPEDEEIKTYLKMASISLLTCR